MTPQLHVDIRGDLLPVRDQGETRPTCLAFAATAAHEFARNKAVRLCVEYLYFSASAILGRSSSHGLSMRGVERALRERGQPLEEVWPYDPGSPARTTPPQTLRTLFRCLTVVHHNHDVVLPAIRRRSPVVLGVGLTNIWYSNLAPSYVIDDKSPSSIGHAVLVVGAREDADGSVALLVQNSWGKGWADRGFAWLAWKYVETHFMGCITVEEIV